MGKIVRKENAESAWTPPSTAEVRRHRKTLKFPKVGKAAIERHLAEYEAMLAQMRKLSLPEIDAVAAVREQREKN
jgi:hypothetical protein